MLRRADPVPARVGHGISQVMLENLTKDVQECLRRARDCAERAKSEPDPAIQRDFFDMEGRWLKLARSFQFLEQLQTGSAHNGVGELSDRLDQLNQRLGKTAN